MAFVGSIHPQQGGPIINMQAVCMQQMPKWPLKMHAMYIPAVWKA